MSLLILKVGLCSNEEAGGGGGHQAGAEESVQLPRSGPDQEGLQWPGEAAEVCRAGGGGGHYRQSPGQREQPRHRHHCQGQWEDW